MIFVTLLLTLLVYKYVSHLHHWMYVATIRGAIQNPEAL